MPTLINISCSLCVLKVKLLAILYIRTSSTAPKRITPMRYAITVTNSGKKTKYVFLKNLIIQKLLDLRYNKLNIAIA